MKFDFFIIIIIKNDKCYNFIGVDMTLNEIHQMF
jgi:hypothetical protein